MAVEEGTYLLSGQEAVGGRVDGFEDTVGGVVANAVASALSSLGVQPRELPLSPPRLWALIEEAKQTERRG